jgi:hypothetical protein
LQSLQIITSALYEETRQYVNGSIKYLKLDDRDREFIQREKEIDEKDG